MALLAQLAVSSDFICFPLNPRCEGCVWCRLSCVGLPWGTSYSLQKKISHHHAVFFSCCIDVSLFCARLQLLPLPQHLLVPTWVPKEIAQTDLCMCVCLSKYFPLINGSWSLSSVTSAHWRVMNGLYDKMAMRGWVSCCCCCWRWVWESSSWYLGEKMGWKAAKFPHG